MIATFIDLNGQTFVREIKKLEKIIKYASTTADATKLIEAFFEKKELPRPVTKTQIYILQTVTNNIPLYKEVLDEWQDAAPVVSTRPAVIIEQPKKVENKVVVDSAFDEMYKRLKG